MKIRNRAHRDQGTSKYRTKGTGVHRSSLSAVTTFEWDATARPPSVANLPASITINGATPALSVDWTATGGGWDGSSMSLVGTGADPTDHEAYSPIGASTKCTSGAKHWKGATAEGSISTGDYWIRLLVSNFIADGTKYLAANLDSGASTRGWQILASGSTLIVRHGASAALSISGTLSEGANLIDVMCNRDENSTNGWKVYVNGALFTSGNASAQSATMANPSEPTYIGGYGPSAYTSPSAISRLMVAEQADWFRSGADGAADGLAAHKEAYALLTGQSALRSKGTQTPTLATRSDSVLLRKEHATLGTLWVPAAANWPAIEHDSAGVVGYAPNASQVCGPYNNGDMSAWTKRSGGSASVAQAAGVDGSTRYCRITVGEYSINDMYMYSPIACTTVDVGAWVRRPAGETGTLRLTNYYGNIKGDWLIDLSALTADKEYWLTSASPLVNVVTPFITNAGIMGGCLIASGGAYSITCDVHVTMVKDDTIKRPVIVGAAARTTAAEVPMYWDNDARNIPVNGRATSEVLLPGAATIGSGKQWSLSASATQRIVMHTASTQPQSYVAGDGGAPTSAVASPVYTSGRHKYDVEWVRGIGHKIRVDEGSFVSASTAAVGVGLDRIALCGDYNLSGPLIGRLYSLKISRKRGS